MTGDMSQSGPYGDHDSGMMYDAYGMDGMVPSQMDEYGGVHRDSGGDYGPIDLYSVNFGDCFGASPTKRKEEKASATTRSTRIGQRQG